MGTAVGTPVVGTLIGAVSGAVMAARKRRPKSQPTKRPRKGKNIDCKKAGFDRRCKKALSSEEVDAKAKGGDEVAKSSTRMATKPATKKVRATSGRNRAKPKSSRKTRG